MNKVDIMEVTQFVLIMIAVSFIVMGVIWGRELWIVSGFVIITASGITRVVEYKYTHGD